MATLTRVCFSPVFNNPFIYPSLCARHRRLWTSISIHSTACFSSSTPRNKQETSENSEKPRNVTFAEKTPSKHQESQPSNKTYDVENHFVCKSEPVQTAKGDWKSKTEKGITITMDTHTTESDSVSVQQEKDITKSRSNIPKNRDVRYERLPSLTRGTDILFTVGKRRTTLKNVTSALATKEAVIDDTSKVGGANYFDELLKPSFQTKRSRTNPPSADTVKLLKHISESHDLSQHDTELYSASLPSLLGVTVDNISDTSAELAEAGFAEEEVDQMLALFPHVLDVNYENVYEVYCLFKEYLQHNRWIYGLMRRYPFLLTLDSTQVRGLI